MPIVLVHLGKIPDILKSNMEYLSANFPNRSKVLISNVACEPWLNKLDFELIDAESLLSEWPTEFTITDRRQFFRNNFWFTTKARLMLLPEFMRKTKIERVLHIENDVWIHPSFPFRLFEDSSKPLAFPSVGDGRGIASTLMINGKAGRELLIRSCLKWPKSTDMEILGKILREEMDVWQLASTNLLKDDKQNEWIFDGAKLGMYLFGSDPRNIKGIIKRFEKSPMGGLERGQHLILNDKELILKTGNADLRIASLHIHSKNTKVFGPEWRAVIKRQLIKQSLSLNYGFSFKASLAAHHELLNRMRRKIRRKSSVY